MKIKIKIKYFDKACKLQDIKKGDWIDLRSRISLKHDYPDWALGGLTFITGAIPLGVAIELPEGFEAIISPRSSIYKHYGIMCTNSIGVVDNSYRGDKDEWGLPFISFNKGEINRGDRICQFRVQLNQKATMWQKLRWLFSSGIEFVEVNSLNNKNRGGFGSTGKK